MKISSERLYQCVLDDISSSIQMEGAPESNWRTASAVALRDSLLKKYIEGEKTSPLADQKALELFLKVNGELIGSPRTPETLLDQHLLGELKASLDRFWYKTATDSLVGNLRDLFIRGRVGPGSSLGAQENDFYTKLFDCKLTTTSRLLYDTYRAGSKVTYLHSIAEAHRAEVHGPFELVKHSKLLFVPKRNDISRTICVEPNLNMFFQLGLANIIEQRLRQVYALDLTTQPEFNRELARQGSIDGSYATIDLSSASDSLSIGVLRDILPRDFFNWLDILRTPSTKLPDGRTVQLNMISTMGNGFTFPLETLIFAAVVDSAYRVDGTVLRRNQRLERGNPEAVSLKVGNFAVFGDDIIVRTSVVPKVLRLLWLLGFSVNREKTFVEGPFRESCGADFFNGRFVRGVYIKTLRSQQDRYIAINLLNDWTATTGIQLCRTVQYLLESVKWVLVSPSLGLDAGLHVPLSMAKPRMDRNGSFKLRCFFPKPRVIYFRGRSFSGTWRKRVPNLHGLELASVAGYVRSQSISLRQRGSRYVMKGCVLPFWDRIQLTRSWRRFSFTRWETAVYLNLFK